MKPARYNFTGYKAGSRVTKGFTLCDENEAAISVAGYKSATLNLRLKGSPKVVLSVTTANGGLTLGGAPFNLRTQFDLTVAAGDYDYDLVLFDLADDKWPVLTGDFEVEQSTV